jgi:glycerate kinase
VLLDALGGKWETARAHDPLGREIQARYALVRDGDTAVVDVAAASGLALVDPSQSDPEAASSSGTGELIAAAIERGARRILVGAGGSATTDGGDGAIEALEQAGGLRGARLEILCDTTVPFEDAARIFAPQKGAGSDETGRLESRLIALAGALPRDPRGRAMTGAAGGLAGGFWAAFDAHLIPGAATVLGMLRFDDRLENAGAVISGEGRFDRQSLEGKLVGEVARRCRRAPIPLHVIAGEVAISTGLAELGVVTAVEAGDPDTIAGAAETIASGYGGPVQPAA